MLENGERKKAIKLTTGALKNMQRKTRFFDRRSYESLSGGESPSHLLINFFRSLLEGDISAMKKDLRSYLNLRAMSIQGDTFIGEIKELERIVTSNDSSPVLDAFFESAVISASLFDEVQPQVILLIRWSRKNHLSRKDRTRILRKALKLSSEGGFEQGERKARNMLDSMDVPR
jgi:hypothetical protein